MQDGKTPVMTFEETVKAFDYGRAVIIFQRNLPANFWENMTIRQQVLVYAASSGSACNELAKTMFYKLAHAPIDFIGWQDIYNWAPPNSDLQALARAKMVELASTVEQWEAVYRLGPPNGDHKRIAAEKIDQLAKTLRQTAEAVD